MNKIARVLAAVGFIGVAQAADLTWTGAENLVPRSEYNKYRLVYDLDIQKEMPHFGWGVQAVPYNIDRSRQVAKGGFSRVAYFVETVTTNGVHNWVWVSLDAFTDDASALGVPSHRMGKWFQQKVKNLRIWSNNETIVHRDGSLVDEGNIEFWPQGYGKAGSLGLPNASNSAYDFDDGPNAYTSNYGSMQIHDYKARCTLFGFNGWQSSSIQLGVGTNVSGGEPDWTGVANGKLYKVAKMQVYVMDDGADATPPEFLSAATRQGGTEIVLTFSKPVAADQDFSAAIAVSGAAVRSVNRDADDWSRLIVRIDQVTGGTVSVTATGVKDASPRGNAMAEPATRTVSGTLQPAEVVAHVSAAARAGYDLIYAYDLPVEGMFQSVPTVPPMGLKFSRREAHVDYPKTFDRIGYYMELVTTAGVTNWVWTSCDAWTNDLTSLDFPSSLDLSTETTPVSNLDVESNVASVTPGAGLAGGSVRISWGSSNADSTMRMMNGDATLWAVNDFQNYSSGWIWCGIGVNTSGTGTADWRNMGNTVVGSTRFRRLYVMVRPVTAAPASVTDYPAPADVLSHVPEAANYALLQDVTIDKTANHFDEAENYASHIVDNSAAFDGKSFRRVAYYLRYMQSGAEKWVWTSFDAPSQSLADIRMPDSKAQNFASRVANMNVRSNVDGVQTGDGIQTGFVEFFGSRPSSAAYLGVPNGGSSYQDIDYSPQPSAEPWGSFMVNNYGANQFVLSVHGLTYHTTGIAAGIGNYSLSGDKSWIFKYTVSQGTFTDVKLYVFVQEGPVQTFPQYLYTIAETGGRRACVLFESDVPDALLDPAAYELYPAVGIKSVTRSTLDAREAILTFDEPLAAGATYNIAVVAAANGATAEPRKAANRKFTVPDETLPSVLSAANVAEIGDYELVYKHTLPSAKASSCGTYGAPYVLDKTRFKGDFSFDRVAYALHLVGKDGSENWAWASMDAFTDNASELGIPSERRKALTQCIVTNLVVRHGSSGGTAPDLTDGDYAYGNIEFFPGNYGAANGKNVPGANASNYDFGDSPSTYKGTVYCSFQVHSYLAGQTVMALNYLGGGDAWSSVTIPNIGIGNCPTGSNPDWTVYSDGNAGSYTTRDLYIFVRPTARGQTDAPAFAVAPADAQVMIHDPLTLVAYAPTAETYQWMKDGTPIAGATGTALDVATIRPGTATYSVTATDAAGHSATASAQIKIISGGTMMIFR